MHLSPLSAAGQGGRCVQAPHGLFDYDDGGLASNVPGPSSLRQLRPRGGVGCRRPASGSPCRVLGPSLVRAIHCPATTASHLSFHQAAIMMGFNINMTHTCPQQSDPLNLLWGQQ
jgi:hypothetical protein